MKHFTSPKRRYTWSLTVNELGDLTDCEKFGDGCEQCIRVGIILMLACYGRYHANNPILLRHMYRDSLLPWILLWTLFWIATKEYDAAVGDVPEAVENAPLIHGPPMYRRICDFRDDNDAAGETTFRIQDIVDMLQCFDLPETVRVDRGRLDGKCYTFHREELLIYFLKVATSGETHEGVCKKYGHRCAQRMGKGFKWLVGYLDERYDYLIGWRGMLLWRPYFPMFAEKIRQYISKTSIRVHPVTQHVEVIPGVWFNPGAYNVVGFVDCEVHPIGTPHSGPVAPEPGSPRRPWWYEFQRAFYDGHHRIHAVKTLSFMLPNGLYAAMWGPASARRNDSMLVHWSHIDDLLYQMQANFGCGAIYIFFGDSKFRVSLWRCIRGRHANSRFGPWRNFRDKAEDQVMNRSRESIEHSYGDKQTHIKILRRKEAMKLGSNPIPVLQLYRVSHLLYNLRVCAYGNVVSSTNAFDCKPPTITQYLNM